MPTARRLLPLLLLAGCVAPALLLPDDSAAESGAADTGDPAPEVPNSGRYIESLFEVTATRGVQYGAAIPHGGATEEPLLLDLYAPVADDETARPAMVWVHGGGFVGGSRQHEPLAYLAGFLASTGYVCVSIDYRLRTPDDFEADPAGAIVDAVHDARAAVRWLRANADELGVDPDRIGIGGGSAGAITSLFVAYDDQWGAGESGNPGLSSEVSAVVDFWGAMYTEVDQMEADEAPFLGFHGTDDPTVLYSEGEALVSRAEAVGLDHAFHPLEGQRHAAWDNTDLFRETIPPFLYAHVVRAE